MSRTHNFPPDLLTFDECAAVLVDNPSPRFIRQLANRGALATRKYKGRIVAHVDDVAIIAVFHAHRHKTV